MERAVLALGSNMGDRRENLRRAVSMLSEFCIVGKKSYVYETPPEGYLQQRDFLNAAIMVETELSPEDLLSECKAVEESLGRRQSFRNSPRPIDIDIIFYGNLNFSTENLTIPHPRWSSRSFVITPLLDVFDDATPECFWRIREELSGNIREFVRFCSL